MKRGAYTKAAVVTVGMVAVVAVLWMQLVRQRTKSAACPDCNVVLIALDPLRADALSSYGNPRSTTPAIDAFARRGYLFTDAYAVAPWTLPSAMSLMTGTYPSVHRIINKELLTKNPDKPLIPASLGSEAPDMRTLAAELKTQGYVTGGFAGGAALSPSYGFDRGFDEYVSDGTFDALPQVLPKAVGFLRKHRAEKMFVFIHGFDVHGQYVPQGGYDRRYVKDYNGVLTGSAEEQKTIREDGVTNGRIFLSPEDVGFLRGLYDEKTARADASVRVILDEIESLKLTEKTIVIVTSNHGEEFYEHGRIDHGMTLFDEVLHIPLIIAVPGIRDQRVVHQQVRNIDVIPTVFSLLRIRPSHAFLSQLAGVSLTPMFEGKRLRLDLFAETDYRYATFQRALRTWDGWKLIYDKESMQKHLYRISSDAAETHDLAGSGEKKESELLERLLRGDAVSR